MRASWMVPLLVVACSTGARTPSPAASASASETTGPVIARLAPDSGRVGVAYPIRITIEGRGFADTGNVVTFGPVRSAGLPSTSGGTRIAFFVPKEIPSHSEVPPRPLGPGVYDVTVTTPAGTSAPAHFTLTQG